MRRGIPCLLGLVAFAGCKEKVTEQGVLVSVGNPSGALGIVRLRVFASSLGGKPSTLLLPVTAQSTEIRFPTDFSLSVPSGRSGQVDIAIDGLAASGAVVANGNASAFLQPRTFVPISVALSPGASPCGNSSLDLGEACDDGNRYSGDGCNYLCQSENPADAAAPGPDVGPGRGPGAGGAVGTGGSIGTDGATGTGGSLGTGGRPGTGGTPGAGGTTGTGGSIGTGGASGTGGSLGTGGRPGTGGMPGTGGTTGTGGSIGTGGASGTGGSFSPGPATPIVINSSNTGVYSLGDGTWEVFYFDAVAGQLYCISDLSGIVRGYVSTSPSVSPTLYQYATTGVDGTLAFTAATAQRYYIAVGVSGGWASGRFQVADGGALLSIGANTVTLAAPGGESTTFFRFPVSAGHSYSLSVTGQATTSVGLGLSPRAERASNGQFSAPLRGVSGPLPFSDEIIPDTSVALSYSGYYFLFLRVYEAMTVTVTLTQTS